jgi:hypothetical protein
VGKISEQKMLGIGLNPITNMQKYTTTLIVERAACNPILEVHNVDDTQNK